MRERKRESERGKTHDSEFHVPYLQLILYRYI